MRPGVALGVAVTVSLGLHLAALGFGVSRDGTQIEAGAGAVNVAIGTSFADMASGTLAAAKTRDADLISSTPPDQMPATQPTPVTEETPTTPAQVTTHSSASVLIPLQLTESVPIPAKPATPISEGSRVEPDGTVETLAYIDAPTPAPNVSKRPVSRPATLVVPRSAPPKAATAAVPRGNAQNNAKAGAQTTPSAATAVKRGTDSTRETTQGNAAATTYPGQVMRKINRVPKPRVSAGGSAVVRFTIAGNGRLAGLSLARSSGSSQFDKAALGVIRRAAPFPAPPPGAQRSFSLTIKGR